MRLLRRPIGNDSLLAMTASLLSLRASSRLQWRAKQSQRDREMRDQKGFTLIEVLITFAIFAVVLGVVAVTTVQLFKSFHQGEKMMDTRQKERLFLFGLSREISSVARITYPQNRFKGGENSFFLSMPRRIAW